MLILSNFHFKRLLAPSEALVFIMVYYLPRKPLFQIFQIRKGKWKWKNLTSAIFLKSLEFKDIKYITFAYWRSVQSFYWTPFCIYVSQTMWKKSMERPKRPNALISQRFSKLQIDIIERLKVSLSQFVIGKFLLQSVRIFAHI